MAQNATDDGDAKPAELNPADVNEGDRVLLGINWHGEAHAGFYHKGIYQSVVEGEVVEAPNHDHVREMLENGGRPLASFVVETDDGERFNWNVDNGYVLGEHPDLGRRTDVGRFGSFYEGE